VLLLGLQWWVASRAIEKLTTDQLLSRLAHDGETLLAGARFDAAGALAIDAARVNAIYQRPFSGHYYVVIAGAQRQQSRSLWDGELAVEPLPPGQWREIHASGPQRQPLLLRVAGYSRQQHDLTIAVAEDLSALEAGLRRFQLLYGAVSAAVLIALLLVQRLIVARGLSPIDAVRENLARLARGEATRIDAAAPAEIEPMIAELNRLLGTLDKRSRRSRDALGNLAHALKTRLAILTQSSESPSLAAHPELRAAIGESTEAMRRIVERELKRARLAGSAMPGRRVDLKDEIDVLVRTLGQLYADKAPCITSAIAPGAQFAGDREDLLELLGNLLDNACKWCSERVSLTVSHADGVLFVVEDDGPGCAPDSIEEITARGYRADESKPGSGLGLAIVRDIVDSYDGSLQFGRCAALGGLRVEVRLPTARHATPALT
jgi:signal transduction histidine kinase